MGWIITIAIMIYLFVGATVIELINQFSFGDPFDLSDGEEAFTFVLLTLFWPIVIGIVLFFRLCTVPQKLARWLLRKFTKQRRA